jgi:hypothetical protein
MGCLVQPEQEIGVHMKQHTLTSTLRVFTTLAFVALITANVTLAQAPPATGPTVFPMVGITGAQTLRLNLVAYPPDPCATVQLGFQNRNGVAVGPSQTVSLQQGQSVSLVLNGSTLVGTDQRVELLPTVKGLDGTATGASCVATVEVVDNANGATMVLAPGAVGYPPSPVFGMLGVTSLETVRLNVVAFPPDPCIGTISFVDTNGTVIGSLPVQLAGGQATHLDLPGSLLGLRTEVRPVVAVTGGVCVASTEVYNNKTRVTIIYFPPVPCSPASSVCTT